MFFSFLAEIFGTWAPKRANAGKAWCWEAKVFPSPFQFGEKRFMHESFRFLRKSLEPGLQKGPPVERFMHDSWCWRLTFREIWLLQSSTTKDSWVNILVEANFSGTWAPKQSLEMKDACMNLFLEATI